MVRPIKQDCVEDMEMIWVRLTCENPDCPAFGREIIAQQKQKYGGNSCTFCGVGSGKFAVISPLTRTKHVKFTYYDGKGFAETGITYAGSIEYEVPGSMMTVPDQIPETIKEVVKVLRHTDPVDGMRYDHLALALQDLPWDFDLTEILGIMIGEGLVTQTLHQGFQLSIWAGEFDVFKDREE